MNLNSEEVSLIPEMRMRGVPRINFRTFDKLQHLWLQEKWKGKVGVSYAECGKSYKSSPTSSIVTFTEESDRITEMRMRFLYLDKNS